MSKKTDKGHQADDHQADDHQADDHQADDHQADDQGAADAERRGLLTWRALLTDRVQETKKQIREVDAQLRHRPN